MQPSLLRRRSSLGESSCSDFGEGDTASTRVVREYSLDSQNMLRAERGSSIDSEVSSARTKPSRRTGYYSLTNRNIVGVLLLVMAMVTWAPVISWLWKRRGNERRQVHLFHESRCTGESVEITRNIDLCGVTYTSGAGIKDNVASVLLAGDEDLVADVFGTCFADKPQEPMLLQTIGQLGCSELNYPISGHVRLRPRQATDASDAATKAHADSVATAWAEAESEALTMESALPLEM